MKQYIGLGVVLGAAMAYQLPSQTVNDRLINTIDTGTIDTYVLNIGVQTTPVDIREYAIKPEEQPVPTQQIYQNAHRHSRNVGNLSDCIRAQRIRSFLANKTVIIKPFTPLKR